MKIIVYSYASNGMGDLNFGKKVVQYIKKRYQNIDVEFLTASEQNQTEDQKSGIKSFNEKSKIPVIPCNIYVNAIGPNKNLLDIDCLIVCPTLNISDTYFYSILPLNKRALILLIQEYDFNTPSNEYNINFETGEKTIAKDRADNTPEHGNFLRNKLIDDYKYINVLLSLTGLGRFSEGIFIDENAFTFEKDNYDKIAAEYYSKLPVTRGTIFKNLDIKNYFLTHDLYVSYSHENFERFFNVHARIIDGSKNVDVVIMGEKKNTIISSLHKNQQLLFNKNFQDILYQSPNKLEEVVASRLSNVNNLKNYRVIHTGNISQEEALYLRYIGNEFSGATGDQSYSEAISASSIILYECRSWKRGFVKGMQYVAKKIDNSNKLHSEHLGRVPTEYLEPLTRAIYLLAHSSTNAEYDELANMLQDPEILNLFLIYKETVCKKHNFDYYLDKYLHIISPIKRGLLSSERTIIKKYKK